MVNGWAFITMLCFCDLSFERENNLRVFYPAYYLLFFILLIIIIYCLEIIITLLFCIYLILFPRIFLTPIRLLFAVRPGSLRRRRKTCPGLLVQHQQSGHSESGCGGPARSGADARQRRCLCNCLAICSLQGYAISSVLIPLYMTLFLGVQDPKDQVCGEGVIYGVPHKVQRGKIPSGP